MYTTRLRTTGVAFCVLCSVVLFALLKPTPIDADSGPPVQPLNATRSEVPAYAPVEDALSVGVLQRELKEIAVARRWDMLRPVVQIHTVQEGENDWAIARRYGLDIDTLRWSNLWLARNPDLIYPGQEVVILPVQGAYHTVKAGESLESIAVRYGVDPADIAQFPLNELGGSDQLEIGQMLVVPGGRLDYAQRILPPGPGRGYALAWPLRGTVSQGYHSGHRAIDIASYYGAYVYASRGGVVTYAEFSPGGWLGFTVTILHDNGLKTRYSHLSGIYVEAGQRVGRGDLLGQVGSTGNSTGPHVHFEVLSSSARHNPLNYLPLTANG